MTESERFKKIHDEIFAKSYKDTLYVFLCGGATDDCTSAFRIKWYTSTIP